MTTARIQPFCKAHNLNFGCFDGKEVYRRSVTERIKALCLFNNHFCLIWKSQGNSFNKATEIVENAISHDIVNIFFAYEYKPKQIECQLNNVSL